MDPYYPTNVAMLAVAGWALWVRRDAWRSVWDRPMNISIVLQVVGTVLTTRLPGVRSVIDSVIERDAVSILSVAAYTTAAMVAILGVYKRLLSDDGISRFMTTRVLRPVACAAVVILASFFLSRTARHPDPGQFLYLTAGDIWLTVYQTAFMLTSLYLLFIVERGMAKLRDQAPESFDICYLLWAWTGIVALVVLLVGLFVNVGFGFEIGWVLVDLAGVLMALGAGRSWLKRTRSLKPRLRSPLQG